MKSIFKSKTFWVNALTMVGAYAVPGLGMMGIDPTTQKSVIAISAINIALRTITKGPVSVLRDAATEP